MITIIVALLVGLALLSGGLYRVPAIGPALERIASWLVPFNVALGVIALVVGVLDLLRLEGILLILAGLVLAVSALRTLPSIGPGLGRLGNALAEYRYVLGAILLIVGIADILLLIDSFGRGVLR